MAKKPEIPKSEGFRVQAQIPGYYIKKMIELIKKGRFRGEGDFVSYCIRFCVDYLESGKFNYSQELPDELSAEEEKK